MNYNIPKSWEEITVVQYQELIQLNKDDFGGDFEYTLEQLAVLLDTSSDDDIFDDLDIDELIDIMNKIKWLKNEPTLNFNKKINNYVYKDVNNLTLGEFIDLEHFFSINYIENLHIIAAILFKQYKINEWNNTIEEPYEYNVYNRSEEFLNLPISYIFGLIKTYLDWKQNFTDIYSNLFEDANFNKIDNEEELDAEELIEIQEEIKKDENKAKFSWEAIIWELSGNNITNFDKVLNTSLILVFNTLSMKKTLSV